LRRKIEETQIVSDVFGKSERGRFAWPLTIFLANLIELHCIIVSRAMMSRKQAVLTTVAKI
jgi:hypothetical protein